MRAGIAHAANPMRRPCVAIEILVVSLLGPALAAAAQPASTMPTVTDRINVEEVSLRCHFRPRHTQARAAMAFSKAWAHAAGDVGCAIRDAQEISTPCCPRKAHYVGGADADAEPRWLARPFQRGNAGVGRECAPVELNLLARRPAEAAHTGRTHVYPPGLP